MQLDKYSHVIFDFDETIVTLLMHWRPNWQEQLIQLVHQYQADFPSDTRLDMPAVTKLIKQFGQNFRQDFIKFEQKFEKDHYYGYKIVDRGWQLLQNAHKANQQLYLLTSNCQTTIAPILQELNIQNYFAKIITAENVDNLKPTPAAWPLIAQSFASKKDYVMVGDSVSDSGFASSVGIDFINVKDL